MTEEQQQPQLKSHRAEGEPFVNDWVGALEEYQPKGWMWDENGIFKRAFLGMPMETAWRFSPTRIPGQKKDCVYLHMIFFAALRMAQSIPKFCLDCYKVVIYPRNIADVAIIEDWQQNGKAKKWACKVGADRRPFTPARWGAYFYCRGLKAGQNRLEEVIRWSLVHLPHLEPGKDIFLKRGCTEYENEMPESHKWTRTPLGERLENEAEELIDPGMMLHGQPDHGGQRTHKIWRSWAPWVDRSTVKYDPASVAEREAESG